MRQTLILLLLAANICFAQTVKVVENTCLTTTEQGEFFNPVFSPDGEKVAFSKQGFEGLFVLSIADNKIEQITDRQGAGYAPIYSATGQKIYYRADEYEGIKKYSSLVEYDLKTKTENKLIERQRFVSAPQPCGNNLIYTVENNLKRSRIDNHSEDRNDKEIYVMIENQKIALYINGTKTILAPLNEGNYIWPQLSPDRSRLMFTFTGKGTYISDLNGSNLVQLGYLNAPQWLNNSWVAGMRDKDNGYFFTESDLYAVSTDGKNTVRLTQTPEIIEMYPSSTATGDRIVYHTIKGEIYMLSLKFE